MTFIPKNEVFHHLGVYAIKNSENVKRLQYAHVLPLLFQHKPRCPCYRDGLLLATGEFPKKWKFFYFSLVFAPVLSYNRGIA